MPGSGTLPSAHQYLIDSSLCGEEAHIESDGGLAETGGMTDWWDDRVKG